jgi:sugar phosphate isomerase/epimerase
MEKPGIPMAEIQAVYMTEIAKLAKDLGTPMVRVFTGYVREGVPYDQQYAQVVEGLKMAGKTAAQYDVTLAVQNHHDIALHHEEMFWLLNEVNLPNVKVAWDAWSPTLEGLTSEEIRKSILRMKPYIIHTTVADYVKFPRFSYEHKITNYLPEDAVIRAVPVGTGIIDYQTFLKTLKEIGYQGYIAYEMCEILEGGGSVENLDWTARRFLEFVEQFK